MSRFGNPAVQVRVQIVYVLGFSGINVPRNVQVVVIGWVSYLCLGHHPGIAGQLRLTVEHVYDFVDVLSTETVFAAVFYEPSARVDHENAGTIFRTFLVNDDDARRNASAVKEVGRQANYPLDEPAIDQVPADVRPLCCHGTAHRAA